MHEVSICFYCKNSYTGNEEHVFPNGLGGQKLYIDCVCQQCNNYFSKLEGELYQKSPIALIRSTEGVESYTKRSAAPAPFKAPILLIQDEVFGIIYEVGQYHPMKTFIRTQIIFFEGQYYLEGNTLEDSDLLFKALQKWQKNQSQLTAHSDDGLEVWKFSLENNEYIVSRGDNEGKLNSAIKFLTLPHDHHLFADLTPRLYLNDNGKELWIRAKTKEEACVFLKQFLDNTLTSPVFSSFKGSDISQAIVNVGFSFDGLKFDQALTKIALNCLLHYFPDVKTNMALTPLVSFVMTGSPGTGAKWDQQNPIFDSQKGCHNIMFAQSGEHTHIRISLFNGQFAY